MVLKWREVVRMFRRIGRLIGGVRTRRNIVDAALVQKIAESVEE